MVANSPQSAMATEPQAPITSTTQPYGEIFDRGYKHYDGQRRGRSGAITSLIGYSMKRAMGVRKDWKAKVLPFVLYFSALIPVIVMVAFAKISQMFGSAVVNVDDLVSYSQYYNTIFPLVGLFVAVCAPEIICVDRHERTLPLYFSRAIERGDYLLAKFAAMIILTMTMTALPGFILWLGRVMVAPGSLISTIRNSADDLLRVILFSLLMSVTLSALALMISAFTNRKGIAVTLIVLGFMVLTGGVMGAFYALEDTYTWAKYVLLGNAGLVFRKLSVLLFGDKVAFDEIPDAFDFSQTFLISFLVGLSLLALLIFRWRYAARDDA